MVIKSIRVKCGIAIICMATLVIGSMNLIGKVLGPSKMEEIFDTIDTFHDISEDSIEVIGYGSSRAWRSLDSMEMYENYGVGMYNYACYWQFFNTSYLFFQDSLESQSPKVVIFEVRNINNLKMDTDIDGQIYATTALKWGQAKWEYLNQCFGTDLDRYLSYFIPIIAFHSNWSNITVEDLTTDSEEYSFDESMGYYEFTEVNSVTPPDTSTFEEYELGEASLEILDSLVETCEAENIEIIFYVAPHADAYNYSEAMATYAAENGCTFIDFLDYTDEIELDWETDFKDLAHLNDSGANKVSNFLAEYIVSNYDVTDMRTVEDNLWEND